MIPMHDEAASRRAENAGVPQEYGLRGAEDQNRSLRDKYLLSISKVGWSLLGWWEMERFEYLEAFIHTINGFGECFDANNEEIMMTDDWPPHITGTQ